MSILGAASGLIGATVTVWLVVVPFVTAQIALLPF